MSGCKRNHEKGPEKFAKLRGEIVERIEAEASRDMRSFSNMIEVLAVEALAFRRSAEKTQCDASRGEAVGANAL